MSTGELITIAEAIKSAYEQDKNSYLVIAFFEEKERLSVVKIKSERHLLNSIEKGGVDTCIHFLDLLPDEESAQDIDYIVERVKAFTSRELDDHVTIILNIKALRFLRKSEIGRK